MLGVCAANAGADCDAHRGDNERKRTVPPASSRTPTSLLDSEIEHVDFVAAGMNQPGGSPAAKVMPGRHTATTLNSTTTDVKIHNYTDETDLGAPGGPRCAAVTRVCRLPRTLQAGAWRRSPGESAVFIDRLFIVRRSVWRFGDRSWGQDAARRSARWVSMSQVSPAS